MNELVYFFFFSFFDQTGTYEVHRERSLFNNKHYLFDATSVAGMGPTNWQAPIIGRFASSNQKHQQTVFGKQGIEMKTRGRDVTF